MSSAPLPTGLVRADCASVLTGWSGLVLCLRPGLLKESSLIIFIEAFMNAASFRASSSSDDSTHSSSCSSSAEEPPPAGGSFFLLLPEPAALPVGLASAAEAVSPGDELAFVASAGAAAMRRRWVS